MAETVIPVEGVEYSANAFDDLLEALSVRGDVATQGPVRGILDELEVTGTSSPVSVASGWAWVKGKLYINTSAKSITVPTPTGATRIDRIVLRLDFTASPMTCEAVRLAGTEGSGTPPALTQVDGTRWEISLAQVSITTGGVITVTSERAFAGDEQVVAGSLAASVAGNGLSGGAGSPLSVNVDDSTIEINSDTLRVKDGGITNAKLANNCCRPLGEIIEVYGATLGGSDGRRLVYGSVVYESWVHCDGGAPVNGVAIPDCRNRVIAGASATHPAGTTGGSDTSNLNHLHAVNLLSAYESDKGDVGGATTEIGKPLHKHAITGNVNASSTLGSVDMRQSTLYMYKFIYVG